MCSFRSSGVLVLIYLTCFSLSKPTKNEASVKCRKYQVYVDLNIVPFLSEIVEEPRSFNMSYCGGPNGIEGGTLNGYIFHRLNLTVEDGHPCCRPKTKTTIISYTDIKQKTIKGSTDSIDVEYCYCDMSMTGVRIYNGEKNEYVPDPILRKKLGIKTVIEFIEEQKAQFLRRQKDSQFKLVLGFLPASLSKLIIHKCEFDLSDTLETIAACCPSLKELGLLMERKACMKDEAILPTINFEKYGKNCFASFTNLEILRMTCPLNKEFNYPESLKILNMICFSHSAEVFGLALLDSRNQKYLLTWKKVFVIALNPSQILSIWKRH
uniref:TGF_BETA_2 domain-containing protein n=1 Tax=Rhabditophanes sp. KR3021 TaxID=114890 RepID=A0AC35TYR5_9BILA